MLCPFNHNRPPIPVSPNLFANEQISFNEANID